MVPDENFICGVFFCLCRCTNKESKQICRNFEALSPGQRRRLLKAHASKRHPRKAGRTLALVLGYEGKNERHKEKGLDASFSALPAQLKEC